MPRRRRWWLNQPGLTALLKAERFQNDFEIMRESQENQLQPAHLKLDRTPMWSPSPASRSMPGRPEWHERLKGSQKTPHQGARPS